MSSIHLSVIIPVYNEEKRLPGTLTEINKYLSQQSYSSEVIVVDGGSKDRTPDIVRDFTSNIGNLKLIEVKNCSGKGEAVKEGMMAAKGDFRLFMDADNSTKLDQVEKMWPQFEAGFDVVIGSRDVEGAVLDPPQPFLRKVILGKGFRIYRKLVIGLWEIQDTQCGFKCFRGEIVGKIFPKTLIGGFAFDPELLVIAKKMGHKIKEVPVYWKNDLDSKVKMTDVFKMAVDLLRIKWNLITGKYDKK